MDVCLTHRAECRFLCLKQKVRTEVPPHMDLGCLVVKKVEHDTPHSTAAGAGTQGRV